MIVSVTELGEYKTCRRRWFLGSRNREGLTRIVPSMALGLGTLLHDALGHWLPKPDADLSRLFLTAANDAVEVAKETYRAKIGTGPSDSELGPILDAVVLGTNMMRNYQAYWKAPLPPEFKVISFEQRLQVAIPGTEHTSEYIYTLGMGVEKVIYPTPRMHYLEGRLDGLVLNTKTGRIYVLEHKSYSSRPDQEDLFHNDQFLGYTWMAKSLNIGEIAGIAYDGLWKRAVPPKTVDRRPGTMADLFMRLRIERSPDELAEFEDFLRLTVLEMANNPAIYTHRTWSGSCRWGCDYYALCNAMSRGEDADYIRRTTFKLKSSADAEEQETSSELIIA